MTLSMRETDGSPQTLEVEKNPRWHYAPQSFKKKARQLPF
jgi:hypothetical protein